jgi:predicted DNA-binding antitoxin AbrB/MazE fold protein
MKKLVITEDQYKRLVKQIRQPDGISCGPTCIKMVGDFFKGEVASISEICKSCGTDNITGTPPERMRKGLNSLDIKYIEHMDDENPYNSLREAIDRGSVTMLRTLTHRVPHWIVVHSYNPEAPNTFYVNDPWLGQLEYNEGQLEEIWRERNYFFFEVLKENEQIDLNEGDESNVIIRPYRDDDYEAVFNMLEDVYSKLGGMKAESIWAVIKGQCNNNFGLSVVAEVNGEVGGFYFLTQEDLPQKEGIEITDDMIGIQGVALGISSRFKNLGIGKQLIVYPQTIGADYIWGYQLKQLDNINDWLKRRKIYSENPGMYITYQIFNNNEESN